MGEPNTVLAGAIVAGGAVTSVMLDHLAVAIWGIPLSTVSAAATGGLVPALLLDPEPLAHALRRWLGSVLLALICTAAILRTFQLEQIYGVAVAGGIAAFGRDLYSLLRGELPPIITWIREKFTGARRQS